MPQFRILVVGFTNVYNYVNNCPPTYMLFATNVHTFCVLSEISPQIRIVLVKMTLLIFQGLALIGFYILFFLPLVLANIFGRGCFGATCLGLD